MKASRRMSVTLLSLILFLTSSCSGSIKSQSVMNSNNQSAPASETSAPGSSDDRATRPVDSAAPNGLGSEDSTSDSLESENGRNENSVFTNTIAIETKTFSLSAPVSMLLGPEALRVTFEPVFGANPRKGSRVDWFAGPEAAARVTDNPKFSYFSPREYVDLGGTILGTIWTPRPNGFNGITGTVNVTAGINPRYMQAIRSFLGDACGNLIRDESAAGKEHPSNVLFTGETLNAERWNRFFFALTGLDASKGETRSLEPYLAAFRKLLPEPPPDLAEEQAAALTRAYVHLCVAIASDPRVISR